MCRLRGVRMHGFPYGEEDEHDGEAHWLMRGAQGAAAIRGEAIAPRTRGSCHTAREEREERERMGAAAAMPEEYGREDASAAMPEEGARSPLPNLAGAIRAPMSPSFTVPRTELVRSLVRQGRTAGIVMVTAPHGFGKTALLIQYADEIERDPERGSVRLVDAAGRTPSEVRLMLDTLESELPPGITRPLLAIDNVPRCTPAEAARLADRLRALRDAGYELLLSTEPSNRALRDALPDAAKCGAQALLVRPSEYPAWAQTFSIASTLDVYELTQGVPALVAALATSVEQEADVHAQLDAAVASMNALVLDELAGESRGMQRLAGMMLLMGTGTLAEVERGGVRVFHNDATRLTRDYPVFGYDATDQRFACLAGTGGALAATHGSIAAAHPLLIAKAARALVHAGRTDDAVELAEAYLDGTARVELAARFPAAFTLAGHPRFVMQAVEDAAGAQGSRAGMAWGEVLDAQGVACCAAVYAAALALGNARVAGQAAAVLAQHAHEIPDEVLARDGEAIEALAAVSELPPGITRPQLVAARASRKASPAAEALRAFGAVRDASLEGAPQGTAPRRPHPTRTALGAVDLPGIYLRCADLIDEVRSGAMEEPDDRDAELEALEGELRSRGLAPVLAAVRVTVSMRRLFAGLPVVDERAFSDAGTLAVRVSDQSLQLACRMLEGWIDLVGGQAVSALFRAQQVLRLGDGLGLPFYGWAEVLACAAHLMSTSRLAVREEAALLDLSAEVDGPAAAWRTALTLSAARLDAELAAWCSLHKRELFEPTFRLPARLALAVLGERADRIRRFIPTSLLPSYLMGDDAVPEERGGFSVIDRDDTPGLGQVSINLFGGFRVMRNGHVITDTIWRRRKSSMLAARLVLAMGALVNRRVLMEELWPEQDYAHARNSLYSALSTLRRALGQPKTGDPQYLICQGEGVAINAEYVVSDVMRFDALARNILLKRAGVAAPQLIEACLKLDQVYAGDLFVPDTGNPAFFTRMRDLCKTKFTDCMMRGVQAALDETDISSASWMVEAALRTEAGREDVIRAAMRVFDLAGRRREVVELYNGHLHDLEAQARGLPEPETRELYEDLIGQRRAYGIL